jgi:Tol biopolymer transport system component
VRRGPFTILVVAMACFAFAVYLGLGSLRHGAVSAAPKPDSTRASMAITGTMYLTQNGGLYRLEGNRFTELQPTGSGWTQPVASPDHSTLAIVKRSLNWSDVFLVDRNGRPIRQLTHDQGTDVVSDHWAFYPSFSADGTSLFYNFDSPKDGFRVDMSIWSQPVAADGASRWTVPTLYTGGDSQPIQTSTRALIYTEYALQADGHIRAQIQLQLGQFNASRALTTPDDDCSQPALSPDGTKLALICTGGGQVGRLVVATFDGANLGPLQVLVDHQLCAAPAWQPDGQALAYLAPAGPTGRFQLWRLSLESVARLGSPQPRQLTSLLEFDATSRIAWFQG